MRGIVVSDKVRKPSMREDSAPVEMKAFFDTHAAGYDAHMAEKPQYGSWRELLETQLPATVEVNRILDLGCGTGLEIEHVFHRQPNARITCVDLSEGMIDLLRKKYPKQINQLTIVQASYFDYDFGSEQFDVAIACVTMHHWPFSDKARLYRKIWTSLKPEGFFIDSDYMVPEPLEQSLMAEYLKWHEEGHLMEGRHYHIDIPFSVATETRALKEAGFRGTRIVKEEYSEDFNAAMIVASK
jgi:tRNA (cmo5U34)-methyltransferase